MSDQNKILNNYMSLKYKVELRPVHESEGGGWEAYIPQLGRMTMTGYGDSQAEALNSLEEVKESIFETWLEKGQSIPEPEEEIEEQYSGKILLRTSKELHRELVLKAQKQGISLNAFLNQTIYMGYSIQQFQQQLERMSQQGNWKNNHQESKSLSPR